MHPEKSHQGSVEDKLHIGQKKDVRLRNFALAFDILSNWRKIVTTKIPHFIFVKVIVSIASVRSAFLQRSIHPVT